jgi:hypothetical protein
MVPCAPGAVPAFSWKADERRPGSPRIGPMAGEGDGQGSRFIVKPVTFEQARAKIAVAGQRSQQPAEPAERCQHFPGRHFPGRPASGAVPAFSWKAFSRKAAVKQGTSPRSSARTGLSKWMGRTSRECGSRTWPERITLRAPSAALKPSGLASVPDSTSPYGCSLGCRHQIRCKP